jgi:hypothetical protein
MIMKRINRLTLALSIALRLWAGVQSMSIHGVSWMNLAAALLVGSLLASTAYLIGLLAAGPCSWIWTGHSGLRW